MNLLNRLFRRPTDPTANWGPPTGPMPDFDLTEMRFGPLRFGAPFTAATFLGRPDHFKWMKKDYGQLLYASRGFQLDFDIDLESPEEQALDAFIEGAKRPSHLG